MMKPRTSRSGPTDREAAALARKQQLAEHRDTANSAPGQRQQLAGQSAAGQAASAPAIRKRRSSINVYDQPSSLNSRLRQLETDMLRLDEDRTKLYDDTHATLAQYDLRLGEIHAILKSRQDNVDKYVEEMRVLLQAKDDFEKQSRLLNEKHERIQEKFMHRETIISREIKLLKNKFELLERNRQFRGLLQKSAALASAEDDKRSDDELTGGLEHANAARTSLGGSPMGGPNAETAALAAAAASPSAAADGGVAGAARSGLDLARQLSRQVGVKTRTSGAADKIRSKLSGVVRFFAPLLSRLRPSSSKLASVRRQRLNKVSAAALDVQASDAADHPNHNEPPTTTTPLTIDADTQNKPAASAPHYLDATNCANDVNFQKVAAVT